MDFGISVLLDRLERDYPRRAKAMVHLLADTRRFHLMQVSNAVAAGLRDLTDESENEGRTYNLALGFDRFGRGVFLLRPVRPGHATAVVEAQSRDQAKMVEELGLYLRSLPAGHEEAP